MPSRSNLLFTIAPGCAVAVAVAAGCSPGPSQTPSPVEVDITEASKGARPSGTSLPVATSEPSEPPAPQPTSEPTVAPPSGEQPRWLAIGKGPSRGEITLRCEGTAEPPTEEAGGCRCGPLLLNPCSEARPRLYVDRRQCFFECGSAGAAGSTFKLRCPDGGDPMDDVDGCRCGDQTLNPCAGKPPQSVRASGASCVVVCP